MDASPPTGRRRYALLGIYVLVAFFYWLSLYLYVPTLPTYAESKAGSLALVGTILAQYGLWQAIIRLPLGIVSTWAGRRKLFIALGIALCGLGAWVMGSAETAQGLLVGRAITGLAAGTWVPLTVTFSSLFAAQEAVRATSILSVVGSVGRVTATTSTGFLNNLGGYSLAFNLAVGAAAMGVLVLLPVPEKRLPPQRPSMAATGRLIVRRDVLLPSLISAVAQYATWAIPYGFLPILAQQLGASGVTQGMLMSLHIGVVTAGSLVAAAIAERFGSRRMVLVSFLVLTGGIVGASACQTLPPLFVAEFFIGLSMGISYPVLMGLSIRDVDEASRTTAMGLHQAVYASGMFAGPWLSGMLAESIGLRPMFVVTAVATLALGLVLLRLLPPRMRPAG